MKVVILAGGLGTRISEESHLKPKPLIEIGEYPIIWHIMKMYSTYGFNDFIICCGYKGYMLKEYFANYYLSMSDVTFDFQIPGNPLYSNSESEPWKVTLVNTGINTMTGGRIKRIQKYIPEGEAFMMTYGDGVSDVNIDNLLEFHQSSNKIATVTAIQPAGKFGALNIGSQGHVKEFQEKPQGDGGWINGGFFVLDYQVFNYLNDDDCIFEREPLEKLASDEQLTAYKHRGFWKAMDTMRDKKELQDYWNEGKASWKIW